MGENQTNRADALARQREVAKHIAESAQKLPLKDSGLWFHDDIRNNFYYASYLLTEASDSESGFTGNREQAKHLAESVLLEVLALQNTQSGTSLYGHWPLGLGDNPRAASPHELPVEIMGSLMAYLLHRHGKDMGESLREAFAAALRHVYEGGFFRKPVVLYNHHEAKYTAAKLIFGKCFGDDGLFRDGKASLKQTLVYIRERGMPEYGCLPWFWHWMQAFMAAKELAEEGDMELAADLRGMLDYLWDQRSQFYYRGAWTGAHSRGWPHDMPGDANVLFDYIQYGDFPLPASTPRTEYAGYLYDEAPEQSLQTALNRELPSEVKASTRKVVPEDPAPQPPLHSYVYYGDGFAAGGMWERVEEFDNEQLRWAYTLPVNGSGDANRLYFFHPGAGYSSGDPRHQSGYMDVLYHRSVVLALFPVPEDDPQPRVIGVLPKGDWLLRDRAAFGLAEGVYFAVFASAALTLTEQGSRIDAELAPGAAALAVEAVSQAEASAAGIGGLEAFAAAMADKAPVMEGADRIVYSGPAGEALELKRNGDGEVQALQAGKPFSFNGYRVLAVNH